MRALLGSAPGLRRTLRALVDFKTPPDFQCSLFVFWWGGARGGCVVGSGKFRRASHFRIAHIAAGIILLANAQTNKRLSDIRPHWQTYTQSCGSIYMGCTGYPTCVRTYTHPHIYTYTCVYIHMCVCTYSSSYIYIYITCMHANICMYVGL